MNRYNIILADDHTLFRTGILALLKDLPNIGNIYEAGTGKEVISFVKGSEGAIDLVILDLKMPEMSGVEVTRFLKKAYPNIKIIILSMIDHEQVITEMIQEGVNSYLLKNCDEEKLKKAILDVLNHGFYYDDKTHPVFLKMQRREKNQIGMNTFLTPREMEVLDAMFKKFSTKEIAENLGISVRTLETHKTNILAKTKTSSTHELVIYAMKSGLVDINILI